jgi:NAD(P)-dependent dehydrogenase (short-subunit alcohol dehydrogenase family)
MRLQGKTALVTGSTSNIGRAIAVAFGREGVGAGGVRVNAIAPE